MRSGGAVLAVVLALVVPAGASALEPVVDHVRVAAHDGVVLDGWTVRPAGSGRVPVVLWSAAYFAQCNLNVNPTSGTAKPPACSYGTGDDPELWDNSTKSEAVPVRALVERGYAVAIFNVRGTGNSGGCFEYMGPREQRDQATLVEWLAARPWSTGAVGMMGLSYHGTTALEAAARRPPHLRAIVAGASTPRAYGFNFSPQGATLAGAMYEVFWENLIASSSLAPPLGGSAEHATVDHAEAVPGRLCPEVARAMTETKAGGFAGRRDAAYWGRRDLVKGLSRSRVPMLLVHGLQDLWWSGHKFDEDRLWERLKAPRQMLLGQWGHEFPNHNSVHPEWSMAGWNDRAIAWFDHWLKGEGPRPDTGGVEFQDDAGGWHRTASWPPSGREAIRLGVHGEFTSYPQLDKLGVTEQLMCADNLLSPALGPGAVISVSDPLEEEVLIAGNPHADLRVRSDQAGGQVSVNLFALEPGFRCDGSQPHGARRLTLGAADLRFHAGNLAPRPFPVNRTETVRIDLANLAAVVSAGHRLAVVVSFGDPAEYETFPHVASRITLEPGSEVRLPLAD